MATAEDDRAAYKKEKIRLEVIISELQRKLKAEKFDKEEYLKGLESREQQLESGKKELKSDRADFESQVQNRAKEIEKQVINDAKRKENAAEQARLSLLEQQKAVKAEQQEWLQSEKEKIDTEVSRQVTKYKAELDEQADKARAEYKQENDKKEKELTSNWNSRNTALKAKFATISGLTVTVGMISSIVALISAVIAFFHGLLPYMIEDGKEICGWISADLHAIFGRTFVFPSSLPPILQLALPLIFLIVIGIWTALDFDEHRWVVFVDEFNIIDEISVIVIGSAVGVSVVFGKLLSEIGINTIMFPIAVYLIYVLIRWLLEIGAVKRVLDGIEKLIKHWNDIESNQKICNLLLTVLMIAAVLMVRSWIKGG